MSDRIATEDYVDAAAASGGGLFDAYALLRHEVASGGNGGTFTTGAWRTRTLNVEKFDVGSIVSLTADQFVLQAGTYRIRAWATCYHGNNHQVRIRNVTDSSTVGVGSNGRAMSTDETQDVSIVTCRFTIAGQKTFELQGSSSRTEATDGFGAPNSFGEVEVYAEVEIMRES